MSKNPGAGQSSGCRRKSRTSRFDRPRASFMSNPFKTRPADRRFVQLHDQFAADPPQKADSMAGHRPVAMGRERTNSNQTAVGANARGRNAAFPWLRPVLADQCRSPQGCLPTMRVQLRGCSSAQRFRAHSRWYRSCGYRHALQVPARDAPSFACSSFS